MKLSQVRTLPFYKSLISLGFNDRTGPRLEKQNKLKIGIERKIIGGYMRFDDEWRLSPSADYTGTQVAPSGDRPVAGTQLLMHLRAAAKKVIMMPLGTY